MMQHQLNEPMFASLLKAISPGLLLSLLLFSNCPGLACQPAEQMEQERPTEKHRFAMWLCRKRML